MNIIISFDDCNISDLKAASLLQKYGFVGTFYMPSTPVRGTQLLTLKEVFDGILAKGQEIGGHTVTHPMDLKLVTDDKMLKFEIENNKFLCELLKKKHVTKFCYPRGRHDERVRKAVADAGYLEARTTVVRKLENESGDPFQTPTTIHMFQREEYNGEHWFDLAKSYFKAGLELHNSGKQGIFFSIWGHTKELNQQDDWGRFEEFLAFMQAHLNVKPEIKKSGANVCPVDPAELSQCDSCQ